MIINHLSAKRNYCSWLNIRFIPIDNWPLLFINCKYIGFTYRLFRSLCAQYIIAAYLTHRNIAAKYRQFDDCFTIIMASGQNITSAELVIKLIIIMEKKQDKIIWALSCEWSKNVIFNFCYLAANTTHLCHSIYSF